MNLYTNFLIEVNIFGRKRRWIDAVFDFVGEQVQQKIHEVDEDDTVSLSLRRRCTGGESG